MVDDTIEDGLAMRTFSTMAELTSGCQVEEAQELSRTIDKLEIAENPQTTTVLVFAYKYKTLISVKNLLKF